MFTLFQNIFDFSFITVFIIFSLYGFTKGFFGTILDFFFFVVGFYLAKRYYILLAEYINTFASIQLNSQNAQNIVAIFIFIAVVLLFSFASFFLKRILYPSSYHFFLNRILGLLSGLLIAQTICYSVIFLTQRYGVLLEDELNVSILSPYIINIGNIFLNF